MDAQQLPQYRSHKIVRAAPIKAFDVVKLTVDVELPEMGAMLGVPDNFFARGAPSIGDYLVVYDDSYMSWSPKKAFEDGYSAL
ncbi:MAG TPA: hypothetical protein VMU59_07420 [Caulobacteraceae bacterium]|nr:hypothetical protein [Caulobacteraceae bacterium]